jgi:hypothetical protein
MVVPTKPSYVTDKGGVPPWVVGEDMMPGEEGHSLVAMWWGEMATGEKAGRRTRTLLTLLLLLLLVSARAQGLAG